MRDPFGHADAIHGGAGDTPGEACALAAGVETWMRHGLSILPAKQLDGAAGTAFDGKKKGVLRRKAMNFFIKNRQRAPQLLLHKIRKTKSNV